MTFFIVEENETAPYEAIKDQTSFQRSPRQIADGNNRLISWNEVYPTYQAFKDAIISAAKADPICRQIRNQSLQKFGFDPFKEERRSENNRIVSDASIDKALERNFLYFAHPLIGNLNNLEGRRIAPRKNGHFIGVFGPGKLGTN